MELNDEFLPHNFKRLIVDEISEDEHRNKAIDHEVDLLIPFLFCEYSHQDRRFFLARIDGNHSVVLI
jgi:hypothetical protein